MVFKVGARISFASVRCEGASILRKGVVGKSIAEIIVALWIDAQSGVILCRSKINRYSYTPFSQLSHKHKNTKITYRSSIGPQAAPRGAHCPDQEINRQPG